MTSAKFLRLLAATAVADARLLPMVALSTDRFFRVPSSRTSPGSFASPAFSSRPSFLISVKESDSKRFGRRRVN